MRLAEDGLSNVAIGLRLKVDEATVRRGLNSAKYQRHLLPLDARPGRYDFDLSQPIVLKDVDAMIVADFHIPLYDPLWVNRMIATARAEELKVLIIGGDFFNFDALSQYDPKQNEAGLEREWLEGLAVMRVLLETFDRIIYVWGNHDARMHKALGHKMAFSAAMKMVFGQLGQEALEKIEFTNLDHCWLEHGVQRWYICHPATYSRVPLTTARLIASKLGCSVITAHSHHCAVGYAANGTDVVAEAGGLFDRSKTAYLQRSTTFPFWQQGFCYLKGGHLRVVSPAWSLEAAT